VLYIISGIMDKKFVKESNTRRYLKEAGFRVTPGFVKALDTKIEELIQDAIIRMKIAKRKTLRSEDLNVFSN